MKNNIIGILISMAIVTGFIFPPVAVLAESKSLSADRVSIEDLQKKIDELTKQIQALQQRLSSVQGELGAPFAPVLIEEESATDVPASEVAPPELTRTILRGSSGEDVRKLQEFLAKDKTIYPEGLITGFFGGLTEKALKRWQERHDIDAVGIVGPQTRARFQDIGRGVIQGLTTQGAGSSGVIPPGLTTAPGVQKKFEETATTSVASSIFIAPAPTTTIPAISAVPAQPISQTGTTTVPATPATPAVPAQPGQTTVTPPPPPPSVTPPPPPSLSPPPPPPAGTVDTTPSSVPANFTATLTGDSFSYRVDMSWSKSTDNVGVTGYKLYKNGAQIWSQATSTSLATLVYREYGSGSSGQSFAYTVAAYDAAGNTSTQSSSVSVTVPVAGGASPLPPPPPASSTSGYAPFGSAYSSSLVISNIQEYVGPTAKSWDGTLYATLYVTWTTNTPATTQYSYKAPSPVGDQSGTQYVPVVINHKTTIGLRSGSSYYYQLKATDANGNTAISESRTFVAPVLNTPSVIDTTLPIISNVKVQVTQISTGSSPYQATITWTSDDPSHTGVFYTGTAYDTSGGMWDIHTPLTTSHTIVTDPLSANVKYEYTLSSYNANAGETLYASNFTTPPPPVAPPPPPPPPPPTSTSSLTISNVRVTSVGSTFVNIAWTTDKSSKMNSVCYAAHPSISCANDMVYSAAGTVASQSMHIDYLTPATTYYYHVQSTDDTVIGAAAVASSEQSFTTLSSTISTTTTSFQNRVRALAQILDSLSRALDTLRKTLK